jgi:2-oxopent-4-enoate/cis-2-oxohex-4-enoate hydratase
MDERTVRLGDALYRALRERKTLPPLTDSEPDLTIDDAYEISRYLLARREADGERLVGKKIGVTSPAVQDMLDVRQPDFGFLTDAMVYQSGDEIPASTQLIQPRAEGEIAFVLEQDLQGPGVSTDDVIRATVGVRACFEIVDSRIEEWKIRIQDTVADNASCGVLVLGEALVDPRTLDLETIGVVVERNGKLVATGAGAACLGSPARAVAWLANTLGGYEIPLKAGEIILSGSCVPLLPFETGDEMRLRTGGAGEVTVRFG